MIASEKIIVTLTSWHKRIQNVYPVLNSLLNQTLKADSIILNLCTEDFPNMEEDLPTDLLGLIEDHQEIELYWYIENYKSWKKHLHVLDSISGDDIVITADDDHLYPEDYIEKMYVSFCFFNKEHPVTLNREWMCHNVWCVNGPGTLYQKKHWGDYKKYLNHDIKFRTSEDAFACVLFPKNSAVVLPVLFDLPVEKDMIYNEVCSLTNIGAVKEDNNLSSEEKQKLITYITTIASKGLEHITTVFNDVFFSKYKYDPKEFVYKPKYWKFSVDIKNEIEKREKRYTGEQAILDAFNEKGLTGNIKFSDNEMSSRRISYIPRLSKEECIGKDNKLIITLASWTKRIQNCYDVLNTILHQTILPDEIILNLAIYDFCFTPFSLGAKDPDLELLVESKVFPKDLYDLIKANPIIKIHWHNDYKLRSWKKYAYTAKHYNSDDVIITIDDDILYKETFIETMIKSYKAYNMQHPITSCRNIVQGGFGIAGFAFLFCPKHLTFDNESLFTPEILHMFPEDNHILNVINFNNYGAMPVIGYDFLFKDTNYNEGTSNFGNMNFTPEWYESYNALIAESGKIIENVSEGRTELNGRWNPVYYNFSIYNLQKYLDIHNREELDYPLQCVYDYIKNYLETIPGQTSSQESLAKLIDFYIL